MMNLLARIISTLSNPIFLSLPIPYYLVFRATNNSLYAIKWTIYSALFVLIVGGFVLYNVRRGKFSDFDVSKREQRPLLFFACTILCLWYIVGLLFLRGPLVLLLLVTSIIFSIVVISFINTRIKASIHLATISAILTAISLISGRVNVFILLLIPLIAWARVTVRRHTVSETIVGALTGSLLTLAVYAIIKYLFHYSF